MPSSKEEKPRSRGAFHRYDFYYFVGYYFVEPEPVGPTVAPEGDVLGPMVLPDGFIALLLPLFTAPDVPAEDEPEPAVEPLVVVLGVDAPTLPEPAPPLLVCANARVDDMARAEAIAMVANFMMSPSVFDTGQSMSFGIVPVSVSRLPEQPLKDYRGTGLRHTRSISISAS